MRVSPDPSDRSSDNAVSSALLRTSEEQPKADTMLPKAWPDGRLAKRVHLRYCRLRRPIAGSPRRGLAMGSRPAEARHNWTGDRGGNRRLERSAEPDERGR